MTTAELHRSSLIDELLDEHAGEPIAAARPIEPRRPRPPQERHRPVGLLVAVLLGQSLLAIDLDAAVVRPVLGALLLVGVPVLVLARRTFRAVDDVLLRLVYAIGLTVLGLIAVPLALNTFLPWAGVHMPLDRPVLVDASTVVDVALLWRRSPVRLISLDDVRRLGRGLVAARLDAGVVVAVLSVVLAVAGAVRLDNGYGGSVAVAAHAAAVIALALALARREITQLRAAATVYLAGVSLLLSTSMRGWFITGHDIQNEYLSFLYTQHAGHWVMSTYPTPYNACLSVNILPTVLVNDLGITGVFAFKVVLQLLFALVPLCVYALSRHLLTRRMSVLATALFVFFPTYFTDMPYLVRQEVAYLFVVLALLAATQRGWSTRVRQTITVGFGVGVVLSHYSTTYMLIITLLLGASGVVAGSMLRGWRVRRSRAAGTKAKHRRVRRPLRSRSQLVLLGPVVVVALAATAWAWSTPATHSGGHLADTVSQLTEAIIHGNAQAGSSDLQYSPFGGHGPTDAQRFAQYVHVAAQARDASHADAYVFPHPAGTVAHPVLATRPYVPLTSFGRDLQKLGLDVKGGNALLRLVAAGVFELFLGIGVLALMVHTRRIRPLPRRVDREQFWLILGSIGALAAVLGVPGLSADYGVLRAFQQMLLFTAPVVAVGIVTSLRLLGRAARPALVALVVAMGLVLTGAQPAVTGGYYAELSQSNSGQYYDMLYVRAPEISAAQWLARLTHGTGLQTVAASDVVSVTRLEQYLPKSDVVTGDYLPTQLLKGSFVFLEPQTAVRHQATVFYTGNLITYDYPTGALDGRLDLVYSSGGTEIYR